MVYAYSLVKTSSFIVVPAKVFLLSFFFMDTDFFTLQAGFVAPAITQTGLSIDQNP